ncbi:MAG: isoprenylcysteine carboxylmethyltransferase family protein [Acidobacteriota bacterium]
MPQNPGHDGQEPWWKGTRGEWLVIWQFVLMGLVFFGPRAIGGFPAWPFPFPETCLRLGDVLMVAGGVLFVSGLVRLGPALTAMPMPKEGAPLVQHGPFRLVRHPIYSGVVVLGIGYALATQGWLTLGYAALLFGLLDVKSRREERWLVERFPEYPEYQRRVRRLIPFLY